MEMRGKRHIGGTMRGSPKTYEIKVEGLVDSRWSEWFGGMTMTNQNDLETILIGDLQDQTALHGVLDRIRDLGLNLISVRRIDGNEIKY
jgi:hypothetical protein